MSVISGDAYWAHVITPNTKYNTEGEWTIEVCNLDEVNKGIAEADGLKVKSDADHPEKGDFVPLKQYARTKEGVFRPMNVKDSQKNPFPTNERIGNGSKVKASYYPRPYEQFGGGVKGNLQGVQVLDLIPYNVDDFDVVEGGYVSEENTSQL